MALFAALIGPYFVDWTSYRDEFEREASRILGRKVQVHGTADARLLPFPSVTFNDVSVGGSGEPGGEAMMKIARFSMDAELAPFLRGEVLIFDMRIEEPEATVRLLPDGTLDWALRKGSTLQASSIVLERVGVTGGTVEIIDEQNGRMHSVTGLDMEMSASSLSGPWRIEGTGAVDGYSGAFSLNSGIAGDDGSIRLRTRLLPDDKPISIDLEGSARFEDFKPRYAGEFVLQVLDMSSLAGVESDGDDLLASRTTGTFALDNERLRVDDYRLEVGDAADPYVVTGEATIDTGANPEFLLIADGQQINIDSLASGDAEATEQASSQSAETPMTPGERLAMLDQIARLVPIPPMPGRASIVLPAIVAGDTTVREIGIEAKPDGDGWQIDHFAAKFPGRTQVEAKGRLAIGDTTSFEGNLLVAVRQPSGLAAWLHGEVDQAIRLIESAGFSADVSLKPDTQRFDNLELVIGAASAKGSLERTSAAGVGASTTVLLQGERLDFDKARALAGLIFGEELQTGRVDATVKVDNIVAFGVEASDVDASFSASRDAIEVHDTVIGDLAGASVTVAGRLTDLNAEEPGGSLLVSIEADKAAGLLSLAERKFGASPLFKHAIANSALFSGSQMDIDLSVGGGAEAQNVSARASGVSGGSDIVVQYDGPRDIASGGGDFELEVTAQNPQVHALLAQIGLPALPIDTPGPGLLSMRIDGNAGEPASVAAAFSTADSEFTANGKARFENAVPATGEFAVSLSSADIEPYLIMNGVGLPSDGTALPVNFTTKLRLGPENIAAEELTGRIGENRIGGELAYVRGDAEITGELSLGAIDTAWLGELVFGPAAVARDGGLWSSENFAEVPGRGFTADLQVSADEAIIGRGEIARDFTAGVAVRDGEVNLTDVTAGWRNGKLSGFLRMTNTGGTGLATGRAMIEDADLADILPDIDGSPSLTGSANINGTFEGTGKSMQALVSAMSGSGVIEVEGLEVAGLDTSGFETILSAADAEDFEIAAEPVRAVAQAAIDGGRFVAGDVTLPFSIVGGSMRASSIRIGDDNAGLDGSLRLDLATGLIDGEFRLEYDPGDEAITGATPAFSIALTGAPDDPDSTLDIGELSNYLSLRAYEKERRKVELLQAGVLEKQRLRRELALQDAEMARLRDQQQRSALEELMRRRAAEDAARQRTAQEPVPEPAPDAAGDTPDDAAALNADVPPANAVPEPAEKPADPADTIEQIINEPNVQPRQDSTQAAPARRDTVQRGSDLPAVRRSPAEAVTTPRLDFKDLPGVSLPGG